MGRIWKKLCLILAILMIMGMVDRQIRKEQTRIQKLNWQAEELESTMDSLGPEGAAMQRNLAKWYNYNLELGTEGLESAYGTILNFGKGQMAVLGVPEWELKLTIYHGTGGLVNHDPATPLPLGGRGNHTILQLSEDLPWTEGMSLYIECLGQRIIYRVESIQTLECGRNQERSADGEQDLLTLVYDREDTRTLVQCVRSGELVLREEKNVEYFWLKGIIRRFLS